jgi:hypothetical protein
MTRSHATTWAYSSWPAPCSGSDDWCAWPLERFEIVSKCEKRLRDKSGEPAFQLKFYAIRKDGLVGGAAMRGEGKMAYHDGRDCRLVTIPGLYSALPPKT